MIIDWMKIIGVVSALVGLLYVVRWLGQRYQWHPEWQRKTLHVGLGMTALSFPWLFSTTWQVFAVCAMGALILLAVRRVPVLRQSVGRALHDVQRASSGELFFALAIVLIYALAQGSPVRYVLPLAILTVADTAAALVGAQWGRHSFAVLDGRKSWEGVVAFVVAAGAAGFLVLSQLTILPWPARLLIILTIAIIGALIEAVAWDGLDNILLPLGVYLTLTLLLDRTLLDGNVNFLLAQLGMLGSAIAIMQLLPVRLAPHTALTGLLTLYCLWMGGPLLWLIGLLGLLLTHKLLGKAWDGETHNPLDAMPVHYWLAFSGA